MLVKARRWIRETFVPGSRPTMRQVEAWVDDGHLQGVKIGNDLYIHDTFATSLPLQVQQPLAEPQKKKPRVNLIDRH